MQVDGDSGGKKVRATKPNSKYNEEISSESETERFVSDAILGRVRPSTLFVLTTMHVSFTVMWSPRRGVLSRSKSMKKLLRKRN